MIDKSQIIYQILEIIQNNPSITTTGIKRFLNLSFSTYESAHGSFSIDENEMLKKVLDEIFLEDQLSEYCYESQNSWQLKQKGIKVLQKEEVILIDNEKGELPQKKLNQNDMQSGNKKYLIQDYPYIKLKENIAMPKFQRSLVWDDERKNKFITSVLKGNPFGFMLIYHDEITHKNQIIDGLQRFTTLNQYEKNPTSIIDIYIEYIPSLEKIKILIHDVLKNLSLESIEDSLLSKFKESLNNKSMSEITDNFSIYQTFFNKVKRVFPEIEKKKSEVDIELLLTSLKEEVSSYLDIKHLLIPVILYKGNKEELPEIFERLNTGGATLTKYEVFASTWSDIILSNIHLDIAKKIEARYKDVIKQTSLSIDNYQEGDIITFRKVSLYEYCFAIGKLIKETAPKLFGSTQSKDDKVDSIGFSVLVVFSRMQYKNMMQLHEKINEKVDYRNLQRFTEAIIEVFKELQTILIQHTMHYSNYIEGQIISMAYDLFRIQYDLELPSYKTTQNTYRKDLLTKFYKHAPFRYLFDMTRNYWSGSGDSKLYDFATAPIEKSKYITEIEDDVWKIQLRNWMSDLKEKQSKTIPKDVRTFIAFLYAPYIKEKNHSQFTLSWIIPKNMLKTKQIIFGNSHPGNIFLIHKELADYQNKIINTDSLSQKQQDLLMHYPKFQELNFITSVYARDEYVDFLDSRIEYLIDVFLSIKSV